MTVVAQLFASVRIHTSTHQEEVNFTPHYLRLTQSSAITGNIPESPFSQGVTLFVHLLTGYHSEVLAVLELSD